MKPRIARIYQRQFKTALDAQNFIESAELIDDRVTAVDMRYRLYQSDEDPLQILKFGNILMRMRWNGYKPRWRSRRHPTSI